MSSITLNNITTITDPHTVVIQKHRTTNSSLAIKIVDIAEKIFFFIKTVILYPFRFLGAKDWSLPGVILRFPLFVFTGKSEVLFGKGYYSRAKDLSPEEAKLYVKYGAACAATYSLNTVQWTKPFALSTVDLTTLDLKGLPKALKIYNGYIFDSVSGLKAMVNEDSHGEVILSFGAIQTANSESKHSSRLRKKYHKQHMGNIIKSFLGAVPNIYHEADQIVKVLKKHPYFQNKRLLLAGSCYGASLASYCGLKNDLEVFAFNPLGLGPGIQTELGQKRLDKADGLIRIISAKNDATSNYLPITVLDRMVSMLGIKTLGSFGISYQIPSAYKSLKETHQYAIRHLMKHVGYDKTTKPCDLSQDDPIFHLSNPFDIKSRGSRDALSTKNTYRTCFNHVRYTSGEALNK